MIMVAAVHVPYSSGNTLVSPPLVALLLYLYLVCSLSARCPPCRFVVTSPHLTSPFPVYGNFHWRHWTSAKL